MRNKTWNRRPYRLIATLCFSLAFTFAANTAITAHATPGDLDLTFSGDGKLLDGVLSDGQDRAEGVAVQQDGKIVVVGGYGLGFAVARYNPDGTLDRAFGDDGRAVTSVFAQAVAIQSDGKIVIGGTIFINEFPTTRFALIRYNSDGSRDTTFGSDGMVTTPMGAVAYIRSIAIHTDGKIVAAGYTAGATSFALARYNPNGSLDTTFDLDGKVITAVGDAGSIAYSLAIQPDGKIVAAGEAYSIAFGYVFALARYNLNGSLDTSFDSDGIATTSFGSNGADRATSIAIQPDGKIVAAGFSHTGENGAGGSKFALARYDSNGSPDTTFDSDGMVITSIGSRADGANSVAIQSDAKIVAGGYSYDSDTDSDLAAVRYNANGSLDTTFDSDGIVSTPIDSNVGDHESVNSLAIQPDGKIVGVGGSFGNGSDSIIVRYDSNGSLDTTFDVDGIVMTHRLFFAGNALEDVAIQPDGKIVAAGGADLGQFAVARYNSDGSRDTTFGGTGIVLEATLPQATAIAVQTDGKILAATGLRDGDDIVYFYFVLTRYNPDGSRDTSFDNDGYVSTVVGDPSAVSSLAIQADGKIVAAGSAAGSFAMVRYNPDGSLDTSFNGDGIVTTPISTGDAQASSVVVQPDRKIVVAGTSVNGSSRSFTVVRYDQNGSLDSSFGTGGIVTTLGAQGAKVYSSVLQPDGKIIVAGSRLNTSNEYYPEEFALVRLNGDGSHDTTFAGRGFITVETNLYSEAQDVAVQSDGKIVVAVSSLYLQPDFCLIRLNANGSFEAGGHGCWATADFDNSADNAYGMALDSFGRAVVVGESDGRIAVARFLLAPPPPFFDFDGDGRADISVFRPSDGTWYLNRSTAGFSASQFGLSTDKITPADYDGDGKTDISVYRDGVWHWLRSSDNSFTARQFGIASDVPVPADFTGDGRAELAIFRDGVWWSLDLTTNQTNAVQLGHAADKPLPGDYDGDGRADQAVYRNGEWSINRSTAGYMSAQFGLATDKLVPADYDADGKTDLAVYRDGIWYLQQSTTGFTALQFGITTDTPAPADYDGDGKTDAAVYRNGTWYLLRSTAGFAVTQFGLANDRPVQAAYLAQ